MWHRQEIPEEKRAVEGFQPVANPVAGTRDKSVERRWAGYVLSAEREAGTSWICLTSTDSTV